ncbi:glycosyltransferase [Cohnella boryungensis]|uniref:glycosyltransferase n=1 Tax=Cohnella boryungensis TaxID=768479 RepID=UPI00366CDD25
MEQNNHTSIYTWPDVYLLADYLCVYFECRYIVVIGSGSDHVLPPLAAKYPIIGLEMKDRLQASATRYPFVAWHGHQLDGLQALPIPDAVLRESLVMSLDERGDLHRPGGVLRCLGKAMDLSPACLLVTTLNHSMQELSQWTGMLRQEQLHVEFAGFTVNGNEDLRKHTMVSLIGNNRWKAKLSAPIKVAAIVTAYNEEDIIYQAIKKLLDQQIQVYVVENWSTDSTYEIVNTFHTHPGFLGCERFPANGPDSHFNWKKILDRVVEVTQGMDADWFIHNDADEIRQSPWPDKNLSEAIGYVDRMGYNAINHILIEFYPTDNAYSPTMDHEQHFRYFDYGKVESDFIQIKAWKRTDQQVDLSKRGGHQALFEGRRVFPYLFVSKHYPYRSQQHAEKKIFRDRKARYAPEELAEGFHTHYDGYSQGQQFVRDPQQLIAFNESSYFPTHLVERLSGIGTNRVKATIEPPDVPISAEPLAEAKPRPRRAAKKKARSRIRSHMRRIATSKGRNGLRRPNDNNRGSHRRRVRSIGTRRRPKRKNPILKRRIGRMSR